LLVLAIALVYGRRWSKNARGRRRLTRRRQLAEANPAAYLPNLATSVNNLAIELSEAGREEEASVVRAASVRRHLDDMR
jgi:hypothetical protein